MMKKLTCLLIACIAVLAACKKEAPIEEEPTEREVFLAAAVTPTKIDIDENLIGTLHFLVSETTYFINLDTPYANVYLSMIKSAIEQQKLINLYMYKGSLEIAKVEPYPYV